MDPRDGDASARPLKQRLSLGYRLLRQAAWGSARLTEIVCDRVRLLSLRSSCAADLTHDEIDSLELLHLVSEGGGSSCIFDVGANTGTWSRLARAVMPAARIVAFEPVPEHLDALRQTANELGRMDIHSVALGNSCGRTEMHITNRSDASSLLEPGDEALACWDVSSVRRLTVDVHRVDDLVAAGVVPQPDFVKLDVQGTELLVLQGSESTLKGVRSILTEVSFRRFYHNQSLFSDVVAWLGTRGYEVTAVGHSMQKDRRLAQVDVLFQRLDDRNCRSAAVSDHRDTEHRP